MNVAVWQPNQNEPPRSKKRDPSVGLTVVYPFPMPLPEYLDIGMWHQPLSLPPKKKPRAVAAGHTVILPLYPYWFPSYVNIGMWFQPLSRPRAKTPTPVAVGLTVIWPLPITVAIPVPVTPVFTTAQSSLQRKPIYYADFGLAPVTFSTHRVRVRNVTVNDTDTVDELFTLDEFKAYTDSEFFPFVDKSPVGDFFPHTITWTLATSYAYMHLPTTIAPAQVLPEQGRSSVGSISLTVEDEGARVTDVMTALMGWPVTLYGGFADMEKDDYIPLYKGTVQSVRLTSGLTGYEMQVHNTQAQLNRQLFQGGRALILEALTTTSGGLTMSPALADNFNSTGYVLIGSEVIKFKKLTGGAFTLTQRAAFNSILSAHSINAPVSEIFPLGPAHPIDILLGMYHGTASKTCLGVGYNNVDWPAFEVARQIIGTTYQMEFFVTSAQNAMEWTSQEIHLVLGAYPFVNADGKISIKMFEQAGTPTASFDHGSIVADAQGRPALDWSLGGSGYGLPINDVTVNYDQNPATGEYRSQYRETRSSSINNHGHFPIVINSGGLRADLPDTRILIAARVLQILNRYEKPAPIITIRTHLQKQSVDAGSLVALTSHLIPNAVNGLRGVTAAKAEVINRSIRWAEGQVEFTLLSRDVQLHGG